MRVAAFLIRVLSFEKGISIGFRSGEYGGQEKKPSATLVKEFFGVQALVARQVAHDDHVPFVQSRSELGFDASIECGAVHRAVDDPRRVKAVIAQHGDKGLGPAVAEWGVVDQPSAARSPASGLSRIGFQLGFVNDAKAFQHMCHEGLPVRDPDVPLTRNLGALLFKRLKVFLYVSAPAGGKVARSNWNRPEHPVPPASAPPSHPA